MIVLTFLCGLLIEAVAVFWVHFAERGRAWRAGAFSALQAAALLGLTECSTWPLRVAFVVGYALGSVVAVKFKERFKRAPFSAEEFNALRVSQ
jgi:hypothetical protein